MIVDLAPAAALPVNAYHATTGSTLHRAVALPGCGTKDEGSVRHLTHAQIYWYGIRACTVVPPPAAVVISSDPPRS